MPDKCAMCNEPIWIAHAHMTGIVWKHTRSGPNYQYNHEATPIPIIQLTN